LGELPLQNGEADIVYCIEVVEHVYRNRAAIRDLCRVSRDLIVLTTPNLWFPAVAHDSRLPFCHWLPIWIRPTFARLFGRDGNENNLFWSPWSLAKNMKDFKRISPWLHYPSYQSFVDTFPFYLPYGTGERVDKIATMKRIYYHVISHLGTASHLLAPSLAGVFKRNKNETRNDFDRYKVSKAKA
jgi:hypothetical protein